MKKTALPVLVALLAGFVPTPGATAQHQHYGGELGVVNSGVVCGGETSDAFDRALALLHHMQYVEAQQAFEDLGRRDPACAMAHWGLAMTLFQPLWPVRPSADDLARGHAALQTARQVGVREGRDDALVAAAEGFYQEPETADWWTRVQRWSDGMNRAHAQHPADIETSAFYALSQLAVGSSKPDRLAYNARAAKALLSIVEREPSHPGAVHYTIHANDVDSRADQTLEVVQSYSGIAPDVPHALHMPTHIFVRLGDWPSVIEWNDRSARAALKHPAGDRISHHFPHAVDYLVYAHLQRGDIPAAREAMNWIAQPKGQYQPSFISAFHLASIPARLTVERRAWREASELPVTEPSYLPWEQFTWAEAISWFARGLGASRIGDDRVAAESEGRLEALRDAARRAGEKSLADYIEIDRRILSAFRHHAGGDADRAVAVMQEAARLESTVEKHPVTPGALYPASEALGDLLYELERWTEALAAYEASLDVWPLRLNSLAGAAAAAGKLQDSARTEAYFRKVRAITVEDSQHPAVVEARRFLDSRAG